MTVVGEIPIETGREAERSLRPVVNASDLPTVVYGSRVVTWWGTVGFMVAEAATLSACLVAYYYVLRNTNRGHRCVPRRRTCSFRRSASSC